MKLVEGQAVAVKHEAASELMEVFFGVSIDSSEWLAERSKISL